MSAYDYEDVIELMEAHAAAAERRKQERIDELEGKVAEMARCLLAGGSLHEFEQGAERRGYERGRREAFEEAARYVGVYAEIADRYIMARELQRFAAEEGRDD